MAGMAVFLAIISNLFKIKFNNIDSPITKIKAIMLWMYGKLFAPLAYISYKGIVLL
jgi:hypothetical protein